MKTRKARWQPPVRGLPAMFASALAAAAFIASGVIRGTYPFGEFPRSTNDLGQQIIPMHAHFRDVVMGQASGDLTFNWASGFGVPFLGDYMAYLGSTLSWIALVFPRDHVDLALYVIAVVAIALAAAAMTTYLRRLRPTGPVWLAVIGGMSYATCAWAIDDAAYMTVWLNGLVAFPVLCLLCEWIIASRSLASFVVTPFVVALLWTSHFYTVYMATIGAAIVVLARLLSFDTTVSWWHRVTGGVRCTAAVGLGIGLAAPLLVPTFRLVQAARPSPDVQFSPTDPRDFLSRLLAGTEGVGSSPGLAVGTVMLLLAMSLPFNRAVPVRERLVWVAAVGLTVLSMQVALTHEVWHGFDTPNGSPFRQAFVVAGLLIIAGWLSGSAGLRSIVAVVAPFLLLGGLYVVTREVRFITPTTRVVVPLVAGVAALGAVVWLIALRRAGGVPRWLSAVAAVLVVGTVLTEATASAVAIDDARSRILGAAPPWGDENSQVRSLVLMSDEWPRSRTEPGVVMTVNAPMFIGGQGPQYYSSTIPDDLSELFAAFGFGYTSYGRAHIDPQNPVIDAIFAVGARVVVDDTVPSGYQLTEYPAAPLVTVRSQVPSSPDPAPFGPQETALGADVYTVPELVAQPSPGVSIASQPTTVGFTPDPEAPVPVEAHFTAACRPGAEVYLAAPAFVGDVRTDGGRWRTNLATTARRPGLYTGAPMQRIGTVGSDGVVNIDVRVHGPARLPARAVGCLDRTRLETAVARLRQAQPAAVDVGGHSIDVELASGAAGTVVIGVVRVPGWQCAVGDEPPSTPSTLAGLIAVPVDGDVTDVSCFYRPRGLRMGLATGGVALVVVGAMTGVLDWRRRRAKARTPA